MILKSSHLRTIRFEIDEKYLGKVCEVNENIGFIPELAVHSEGKSNILIQRWSVNYLSSHKKEQLIAYVGEMESHILPNTKHHDLNFLTEHLRSSFLNVQLYLHEHVPANYRTSKKVKKDFERFADQALNYIEQAGFYR